MAVVFISNPSAPALALPAAAAFNGSEIFPLDQTVAGVLTTARGTIGQLATFLGASGGFITAINGTANEIAASTVAGVTTLSFAANVVIPSPPSGTPLTVKGIAAGAGTVIVSDSMATPSFSSYVIAASTYTAGQWGIGMDTSDNFCISRIDSFHTAFQIALAGGVTIPVPASGNSLTINTTAANAIVLNVAGGGTGGILNDAILAPTLTMNAAGADFGQIGNNATQQWYLGHGPNPLSNGTATLTWNASGQVAIPAVTSGTLVTGDASATSQYTRLGQWVVATGTFISAGFAELMSDQNRTTYIGTVGAASLNLATTSIARVVIGATGFVSVLAPSSVGTAFTSTAIAGGFAGLFAAPNSAANSFGMLVTAGTNASDTCAQFNNAANSVAFMRIFGTGQINYGDGTVTASMQYGGVLQFGSVSAHVLSLFTNNTNWWDIAVDGGLLRHGITGGSQGAGSINANSLFISANQIFFGVPASASTTIARTDVGKTVVATGTITVPNAVFSQGDAVSIYNNSGASITISAGITTMRLAGTATTGSRTLAQRGMATLWFNSGTEVVVMGAGVT